jgi:DNA topoisomerase-1
VNIEVSVVQIKLVFRWEEEKKEDGIKWKTLEHKGPLFAPAYEPLPKSVKFIYDGKVNLIRNLKEKLFD